MQAGGVWESLRVVVQIRWLVELWIGQHVSPNTSFYHRKNYFLSKYSWEKMLRYHYMASQNGWGERGRIKELFCSQRQWFVQIKPRTETGLGSWELEISSTGELAKQHWVAKHFLIKACLGGQPSSLHWQLLGFMVACPAARITDKFRNIILTVINWKMMWMIEISIHELSAYLSIYYIILYHN